MSTADVPAPSPHTSEDNAESSLAEQGSPGTPDAASDTVPSPGKNQAPTDPATGHYGPGYGDPTRHYGNDSPSAIGPRT